MVQLRSAYILNQIEKSQIFKGDSDQLPALLRQLSIFDFEVESKLHFDIQDDFLSIFSILSNIFSRNSISLSSDYIEKFIAEKIPLIHKLADTANPISSGELCELAMRCLYLIDPRVTSKKVQNNAAQSSQFLRPYHEDLLYSVIPRLWGDEFLQLWQRNRPYASLIEFSSLSEEAMLEYDNSDRSYNNLCMPLSLENPISRDSFKGLVIEISNFDYETISQRNMNVVKSEILRKASYSDFFEIQVKDRPEISKKLKKLESFFENEYFYKISQNFHLPIWELPNGLDVMQLILTPIAIARVQKVFCEMVLNGSIDLTKPKIKIAFLERDVPCGFLAMEDLKIWIREFFKYFKVQGSFPDIEVDIFVSCEFEKAKLNQQENLQIRNFSQLNPNIEYDILFDISILLRSEIEMEQIQALASNKVIIRSAYSLNHHHRWNFIQKPTQYTPNSEAESNAFLNFLSNNLFRIPCTAQEDFMLFNALMKPTDLVCNFEFEQKKMLPFVVSLLLNAGMSFFVFPNDLEKQIFQLKILAWGIDSVVDLSKPGQFRSIKGIVSEKCLQGRYWAAISSQQKIRDIHWEKIYQANQNQIQGRNSFRISQIYLFNFENSSIWHPAYSPSYFNLPDLIRGKILSVEKCQLRALVSQTTFNVLREVKQQLKANSCNEIFFSNTPESIDIESIVSSEIQSTQEEGDLGVFLSKQASKKQTIINKIIKEIIDKNANCKIQIHCPNLKEQGISDANQDGLFDKISKTWMDLSSGYFLGLTSNLEDPVSKFQQEASMNYYQLAQEGNIQLFVSNSYPGSEVHAPGFSDHIHFVPPDSIEVLIKYLNPEKYGKNYLIFSKESTQISKKNAVLKDDEFIYEDILETTNFDTEFGNLKHSRIFAGKEKEAIIAHEILNNIEYPFPSVKSTIINQVYEEFGLEVELAGMPSNFPYQLHVTSSGKNLGYIDFIKDGQIFPRQYFNYNSTAILNTIKVFIDHQKPEKSEVFDWIESRMPRKTEKGISHYLQDEIGSKKQILIPFRNHIADLILELLKVKVSENYNESNVSSALGATNYELFFAELCKVSNSILQSDKETKDKIIDYYFRNRTVVDTLVFLNRMSLAGLVDHYYIDHQNKQFIVDFTIEEDDYYLKKVYGNLNAFLTAENVKHSFDQIINAPGNTVFEKCVNANLEYVYKNVYPYHQETKKQVKNWFSSQNSLSLNSQEVKYYFEARYISKIFNNQLNSQDSTKRKFSIVHECLERSGSLIENWKHLEESVRIEKQKAADDPVLNTLESVCELVLKKKDDRNSKEISDKISASIIDIYLKDHEGFNDSLSEVKQILNQINTHNPVEENLEQLLRIKMYLQWLKKFKAKFLNGYGRTN